jgi:hypothetical protein
MPVEVEDVLLAGVVEEDGAHGAIDEWQSADDRVGAHGPWIVLA